MLVPLVPPAPFHSSRIAQRSATRVISLVPDSLPFFGLITFHLPSQKSNCRNSGATQAGGGADAAGLCDCARADVMRPSVRLTKILIFTGQNRLGLVYSATAGAETDHAIVPISLLSRFLASETLPQDVELDLLNIARSRGQTISSDFAQVITINFGMVVAIYYFLHRAGIGMKAFAFAMYTVEMLAYVGMMLLESNVGIGPHDALCPISEAAQSLPTRHYLAVRASWVGKSASVMLNLVFWVLWLGIAYLLFFWQKPRELAAGG